MAYIDPATVDSPRRNWKLDRVLYNGGQDSYAVAEGTWDGEPRIAMRWNGSDEYEGVGNPQSRGRATWFLLPEVFSDAIRKVAKEQSSPVTIEVTCPKGYMHGAWHLVVELTPEAIARGGKNLAFDAPTFASRMIQADRSVGHIAGSPELGFRCRFVDGRWIGDVYTNGVPEDKNPIPMDVFTDALAFAVAAALPPANARR